MTQFYTQIVVLCNVWTSIIKFRISKQWVCRNIVIPVYFSFFHFPTWLPAVRHLNHCSKSRFIKTNLYEASDTWGNDRSTVNIMLGSVTTTNISIMLSNHHVEFYKWLRWFWCSWKEFKAVWTECSLKI